MSRWSRLIAAAVVLGAGSLGVGVKPAAAQEPKRGGTLNFAITGEQLSSHGNLVFVHRRRPAAENSLRTCSGKASERSFTD